MANNYTHTEIFITKATIFYDFSLIESIYCMLECIISFHFHIVSKAIKNFIQKKYSKKIFKIS